MPRLKVSVKKGKAPKGSEDIEYYRHSNSLELYYAYDKKLDSIKQAEKIREKLSGAPWASINDKLKEEIEINAKGFSDNELEAIYEMVRLKNYKFEKYKTDEESKKNSKARKINLKYSKSSKSFSASFKEREKLCEAIEFCRDIVNSNADQIHPEAMEKHAKALAKNNKSIKVKVINSTEAKKLGMGCLIAVGQESLKNAPKEFHPRLVIMEYTPSGYKAKTKSNSKRAREHIALVGKGITFDTGGLCLKPTKYMLDMKSDMGGAATVLSVIKAITLLPASARPKHKVTAIMALTENGFGASSYKPGDVLKAMNGKTVQVVDTDAEGRLALADALSYVSQMKDSPDLVMDFATLTGSIVAALGEIAAGVMTNSPKQLEKVKAHFDNEGEFIWQMPIHEEYKKHIKSPIADLAHCNGRPDASVAALFLKEFIDKNTKGDKPDEIDWIHFDIAGKAFLEEDGLFSDKGATGFAIKSLVKYLTKNY